MYEHKNSVVILLYYWDKPKGAGALDLKHYLSENNLEQELSFQKVVIVFLLVGMDSVREQHQSPREQLLQPPVHRKDSSIC